MAADNTSDELTEMIREVRQRVRARHPTGALGVAGIAIPDLLPVMHARDAASAKVAAIGQVNPRRGGMLNGAIQSVKRLVARALDWHVRDQVEFNRGVINCLNSVLETLNENNRALSQLAGHCQGQIEAVRAEIDAFDTRGLKDIQAHWGEWRVAWEDKLAASEIYLLRSVSELQAAFQLRVTNLDASFREIIRLQHANFSEAAQHQHAEFAALLEKSTLAIQQRLWDDQKNVRAEYEKLIHSELRVIRQRTAAQPAASPMPAVATAAAPAPKIDFLRFADRFRGSEDNVRHRARHYVENFRGANDVLDLGCGRGEFLEAMREAGIRARGVDRSAESVALARAKGLEVADADLFEYLDGLADLSLDGIYCSQVVEHLPPERLPDLAALASAKLRRGGTIAIETPNPECLAIFATHFYLDPTHARPVPPALLVFYLEEAGFGAMEVQRLYPAVETMPSLAGLPQDFRDSFFGGLDYSVVARKL
ncbi:MAG: class I SAM-dependent methyltransferase [Bryobacteraceae bacterium]